MSSLLLQFLRLLIMVPNGSKPWALKRARDSRSIRSRVMSPILVNLKRPLVSRCVKFSNLLVVFVLDTNLNFGLREVHQLQFSPQNIWMFHWIMKGLPQLVLCSGPRRYKFSMRQHALFAPYFGGSNFINMNRAENAL